MTNTLFVVPTPLGNLEDITLRALRTLKEVTVIAAEDTRRSRILLRHYDIATRVVSHHEHSTPAASARIIDHLESGDVALITDAGMPGISDPGVSLIQAAVAAGHQVDVLPGASAVTTAVAAAALPAEGFIFVGFLPRRSSAASAVLQRASSLPYALVLFESPRRVAATLSLAMSLLGDRQSVALKEMSKLHQEVMRGSLSELVQALSAGEPRGEWTLVIGPGSDSTEDIDDTAVLEVVQQLIEGGASPRDAARQAAERLEVTRTRAYNLWTKRSRV